MCSIYLTFFFVVAVPMLQLFTLVANLKKRVKDLKV